MSLVLDHSTIKYIHTKQEKIALTSFYDKMEMVNSNDCFPYGYKKKLTKTT
jgi:hypothetical protein